LSYLYYYYYYFFLFPLPVEGLPQKKATTRASIEDLGQTADRACTGRPSLLVAF
jgi:hypothetical protein